MSMVDFFQNQASGQLNDIETQWRAKLAQLFTQQTGLNASVLASLDADGLARLQQYLSSVNPIVDDIQAQGFDAAPVQQQATLDTQRLQDFLGRQNALTQRFGEIDQKTFADRDANATAQMAGARAELLKAALEARAEEAGGGGGGGGGRGGSGSGYDTPTAGEADDIGRISEPLPDVRDSLAGAQMPTRAADKLLNALLYGNKTGNPKVGIGGAKIRANAHVDAGGSVRGDLNAGRGLAIKYLNRIDAQNGDKSLRDTLGVGRGEFLESFLKPLGGAIEDRQGAKAERLRYAADLNARGFGDLTQDPNWRQVAPKNAPQPAGQYNQPGMKFYGPTWSEAQANKARGQLRGPSKGSVTSREQAKIDKAMREAREARLFRGNDKQRRQARQILTKKAKKR